VLVDELVDSFGIGETLRHLIWRGRGDGWRRLGRCFRHGRHRVGHRLGTLPVLFLARELATAFAWTTMNVPLLIFGCVP